MLSVSPRQWRARYVEHNVWWINLQAPLARYYFEKFGPDSREWRSYHLERFIEALVKIHLSYDFQISEDEIERRWREIASDVQRRALKELESLLSGEELAIVPSRLGKRTFDAVSTAARGFASEPIPILPLTQASNGVVPRPENGSST